MTVFYISTNTSVNPIWTKQDVLLEKFGQKVQRAELHANDANQGSTSQIHTNHSIGLSNVE